jgi:cytochrome c-type biogenesis protein CcmH/NrfG
MLGQVEIVSGISREAETALLKALSLDPHNYQALFGLGKVFYDMHR